MIKKATSLLLSMSLAGFLSAQSNWSYVGPAFDASVNTIIEDTATHALYVGGNFSKAGSLSRTGIAKWNGTNWVSLGQGITSGSGVYSLGFYGGNLIATGTFTSLDSVSCKNIGKWNGSTWSPLGNGLEYTGATTVSTQIVMDGDLYVGGTFNHSGSITLNNIAKWDGSSWSALGTGLNGPVTSLAVFGGDLYVAGSFTSAGGVSVHNIAKWDGSSWSDVGGGVQKYTGATTVSTMLTFGQALYVGGDFNLAGSDTVNHFASWNGSSWTDAGGTGLDYTGATTVSTQFAGEYSGSLVASVAYTNNVNNAPIYRMMVYHAGVWSCAHTMNGAISCVGSNNGALCVGGSFTLLDADSVSYLATLLQSGRKGLMFAADEEESNGIVLYPNPVQDELHIRTTPDNNGEPMEMNFMMYDMTGREVMRIYNISTSELEVGRNGLAAGLYMYQLTDKNNAVIKQGKLTFK